MRQIILFFLLSLHVNICKACSCTPSIFSVERIIESTFVLRGQVIKTEIKGRNYLYTFKVDQVIKGSANEKTIKVLSSIASSACGIKLDKNRDIFLFVYRNKKNELTTNRCSSNTYVDEANDKFIEIIEDYVNARTTKFWRNVKGDTIAYGQVINGVPQGYWKIFMNKRLLKDGIFINGEKAGTWNRYKRNRNASSKNDKSLIQENMIEPNCKEIKYVREYDE